MTTTLLWADQTEVPGQPHQVTALADRALAYADTLGVARTQVGAAQDRLARWHGPAAESCGTRLRALASRLDRSQAACHQAAVAARVYADQLRTAQASAARGRAIWAEADAKTEPWGVRRAYMDGGLDTTLAHASEDPGGLRRGWARAVVSAAIDESRAAAAIAAARIAAVLPTLRDAAVTRPAGELVTFIGRETREGLTNGVGELVATVRWAEGATLDPASGARDLAASTRWTLTHPVTAMRDETNWDDLTSGHPIRGFADLVPGMVAAYLTGGAAKALTRVERAELATELPAGLDGHEPLWHAPVLAPSGPVERMGGTSELLAAADDIAHGHAWIEHASDWRRLGIQSRDALAARVARVMERPTFWASVADGRVVFWDGQDRLFVVHNPNPGDEGTAFVARKGFGKVAKELRRYFGGPIEDEIIHTTVQGQQP